MTPVEVAAECRKFASSIKPNGKVLVSLVVEDRVRPSGHFSVSIYSDWPRGDAAVNFYSEALEDIPARLSAEWEKVVAKLNAAKIEKLALEIIRVTDAKGKCTAADLRILVGVSDDDVKALGQMACEAAERMAKRSPFSIVETSSNGVPSVEHEEAAYL